VLHPLAERLQAERRARDFNCEHPSCTKRASRVAIDSWASGRLSCAGHARKAEDVYRLLPKRTSVDDWCSALEHAWYGKHDEPRLRPFLAALLGREEAEALCVSLAALEESE
jgi:hypothetical protein